MAVRCVECKRPLRSAESVARRYGRVCGAKIAARAAALKTQGVTAAALDKAVELIADGGVVPVKGRTVFRMVSTDGQKRYLTHQSACTCPAGTKGRHLCYHRVAAMVLSPTPRKSLGEVICL